MIDSPIDLLYLIALVDVLPIGEKWQDTVAAGEALDKEDGVITRMSSLARDHKIWLSCGGFNEKVPNEDRVYNSHLIIDNTGKICAVYRKIHLFDVVSANSRIKPTWLLLR